MQVLLSPRPGSRAPRLAVRYVVHAEFTPVARCWAEPKQSLEKDLFALQGVRLCFLPLTQGEVSALSSTFVQYIQSRFLALVKAELEAAQAEAAV